MVTLTGEQRQPNVVHMVFGSHLYGLNTPASDFDYKGIYLPNLRELLLNTYPQTYKETTGPQGAKNRPGDIDMEVISLPKFIKLAVRGETLAIDMLHCTNPISSSEIWEELVHYRSGFYSKSMSAFMGYVHRQAAKYGVKGSRVASIRLILDWIEGFEGEHGNETWTTPIRDVLNLLPTSEHIGFLVTDNEKTGEQTFYVVNGRKYQDTLTLKALKDQLDRMMDTYGHRAKLAESNFGVDWKAVSHAFRAAYQLRDIFTFGDFEYPLREAAFVKDVKLGKLDFTTDVQPRLEELVELVEALSTTSNLPDTVDEEWWENWLMSVYDSHLVNPN